MKKPLIHPAIKFLLILSLGILIGYLSAENTALELNEAEKEKCELTHYILLRSYNQGYSDGENKRERKFAD